MKGKAGEGKNHIIRYIEEEDLRLFLRWLPPSRRLSAGFLEDLGSLGRWRCGLASELEGLVRLRVAAADELLGSPVRRRAGTQSSAALDDAT